MNAPAKRTNGNGAGGGNTVLAMLRQYKDQIQAALPRHMSVDRMVRIATTEIRRTPKLMQCDPVSLFGAVIQCAQLGLEPGINGQAYLIPFWNGKRKAFEVQFIPGYKGLMDLARRSGHVQKITARVVRKGDEFDFCLGTDEHIRHVPIMNSDVQLSDIYAAYAVATLKDGTHHLEIMSRQEIDAIRARSKAGDNGPWVTDYEEMAKKTVVRRLCKYLPASVELATAVTMDELAEAGVPQDNRAIIDVVPDSVEQEEMPAEAQEEEPAAQSSEEKSKAKTAKTAAVKQKLAQRVGMQNSDGNAEKQKDADDWLDEFDSAQQ